MKQAHTPLASEEVLVLASTAIELAHRPFGGGKGYDSVGWQNDIDKWLQNMRGLLLVDQVRVVGRLRAFGDAPERGLVPLREAALAQIHTQQAERLSVAAGRLSIVGIAVAVVGVALAAVQVWITYWPPGAR